MKRLIIFLIRKRLGLKKYQNFQFVGQKSNAFYYFTNVNIMKQYKGYINPSDVSLNWLLNDECEIRKLNDGLTDYYPHN